MNHRIQELEETLPRERSSSLRKRGQGGPALHVAFFCERPLELPSRHELVGLETVLVGRGRARRVHRDLEARTLRLEISDPWASSAHARLMRAGGSFRLEDTGSRNGVRVNGELVQERELADGDVIEVGRTLFYYRDAEGEVAHSEALDFVLPETARTNPAFATLSKRLAAELAKAWELAASDLPLLIQGESGTGKEVLARALAQRSSRRGPFVGVNCGAIVPSLMESELFGHVKGAFTGAESNHLGLVRSADKGTLFLDEIGDLEPGAQAALLRVLQEREVRPVGATRSLSVDVRVLSATHRDLDQMARDGAFRADLLARLSGFRLSLPPLRERREDIGLIVAHLLGARRDLALGDLEFEPEAARRLFRYDWPLNIRELDNCLRAAAVLSRGGPVTDEHLAERLRAVPLSRPVEIAGELSGSELERRERLIALLTEQKGNVSGVARALGKARTQVQRWLKHYRLDPRDYQG